MNRYLNTNPWKSSDLQAASTAISKAIAIDEHPDIKRKRDEVRAEQRAYNMFLDNIDSSANKVTFVYREGGESTNVEAALGELLLDRFKVVKILPDRVSVEDTKRKNRPLTWYTNGEVSSP